MNYADELTEKKIKKLERELTALYNKQYKSIQLTYADYLAKFEKRDEQMREDLKDKEAYKNKYCVGATAGMKPEEHYREWRKAQIGRGKRWKAVKDDIAKRITETNEEAAAIINSATAGVYKTNHDYTAYEIEKASGVSFNLLDDDTLAELISGKNHTEFRTVKVNPARDYTWNSQRIENALMSGIIQGKSIPKIASDFYDVMGSNKKAAIRNARTAVTSAQAAGHVKTYEEAAEMGIEIEKEWVSAVDDRTRESHAELNGIHIPIDEVFPNGCSYPADPAGAPEEVYNCRCTLAAFMPKYSHEKNDHDIGTYQDWIMSKI